MESTSIGRPKNKIADYFFAVLIVGFLTSLNGLDKFPYLLPVSKVFGGLIILFSFFKARESVFPKSLKIYFVFIFFALVAGMISSISFKNVFGMCMTSAQLGLTVLMVARFYVIKGDYKFLLISLIINGVILSLAGHFLKADLVMGKQDRLTSLLFNSNEFGRQMLYSNICLFFFWRYANSWYKILIIILGITFFYQIVLSGSRTALIGYILGLFFWLVFSFRPGVYLKSMIITVILSLIIGGYIYQTYLADSPVIKRFYTVKDEAESGGSAGTRIKLIEDAAEAFSANPFIGIGLDNFRLFTSAKTYAHSNYMELLADTGVIGFIIFFMIYAVVWRDALLFSKEEDEELYMQGYIKTVIIILLLVNFSVPTYFSISAWFFLSTAIIIYESERWAFELAELEEEEEAEKEVAEKEMLPGY